jgi:hypothetical protein
LAPGVEIKTGPPVIFTPKKFVPKTSAELAVGSTSVGSESAGSGSKIKPKWSPSGSLKSAEPTYRKIRPIFDAGKGGAESLFKTVPGDVGAKVGDEVKTGKSY